MSLLTARSYSGTHPSVVRNGWCPVTSTLRPVRVVTRKHGLTPLSIQSEIAVVLTLPAEDMFSTRVSRRLTHSSMVSLSPLSGSTTRLSHFRHFPIAGLAASMIRSLLWKPVVSLSFNATPTTEIYTLSLHAALPARIRD